MSDAQLQLKVGQDIPRSETEGDHAYMKGSKRGELCVVDFFTEMALEGRGFQVRAGTITTPLVGDVVVTDTAAELCVDVASGFAAILAYLNIAVRLGTGTLHEYALKSVDAISTVGAAFIPLSIIMDTNATAARSTARVAAAGGVTVTAELATTTRRHWAASNPVAVGAGHSLTTHVYQPRCAPVIANIACGYVQIAATGTGPSYYASLDFLELLWSQIS